MIERNLYEVTGNVLDINTMLINRNELKALVAEVERWKKNEDLQMHRAIKAEKEVERLKEFNPSTLEQIVQVMALENSELRAEVERLKRDDSDINQVHEGSIE